MATWQCVRQCGACCHLDPSDRPDLDEYLSPEDLDLYLSMVGEDGWCVNFDRAKRECRIYTTRPRFCRVEADVFQEMYGVKPDELDDFAIACCREHINDIYGARSLEMLHYNQEVSE